VGAKTEAQTRPLWAHGIEGQRALVTGAGRGLGRACALALSQAGAQVIAVARSAEDLDRLAADAPGPVDAWVEDVCGERLLARIEALARLDVLVNNAGTNRPQTFLEVTDDALDSLLALNVRAAFRVARSAARVMARAGRGSIIHMSSQMGHVGSPQRSVYCMTKHAIEGLSKAMAVELASLGIRVNTVAPTFVDTPMTRPYFENPAFAEFVMRMIPAKRLGTLDEVAAAVLYLASPASGIVTGTSLRLDGGWTAH
jgi:NAD(P)-dependent dehydrogenase (short-subunit alcohol dehydrogenase family)